MRDQLIQHIVTASKVAGAALSHDVVAAALPAGDNATMLDCSLALTELGAAVSVHALDKLLDTSSDARRTFGCGLYIDDSGNVYDVTLSDLESSGKNEFLTGISDVLVFQDVSGFGAKEENADKGTLWFWPAVWRSRAIFGKVITASFVINILSLVVPLIIMAVYDRVLPNFAMDSLTALLGAGVVVLIIDFILRTIRAYFIDTAGANLDMELSDHLFNKILGMRMDARPLSSGVMANSVKELDVLRDFFTSATVVGLVDLPFVVIFFVIISLIGGPLVYVLLTISVVLVVLGFLVGVPLYAVLSRTMSQEQSRMGVLFETLSNVDSLKVLDAGPTFRRRWRQSIAESARHAKWTRGLSMLVSNATAVGQQAATIGLLGMGVLMVKENELTSGAMIACVILSGRALAPMAQVANMLTRINHAKVAYQSLDLMMASPSDRGGERYMHRKNLPASIQLENISYGYPGSARTSLEGVSLNVVPGKKIGILGRVGAGKTTLLNLVAGLYTPGAGQILIGGVNAEQLDPTDLRAKVGVVLQDAALFKGTLRENLTLGKPEATDEEVVATAKVTGLDAMIAGNEAGYDRMIGERGLGLSGGQKQLVALTRAMIRNTDILLMDEPTSAMDSGGEQALIARLSDALADKTLLIATHKMSMLSLVDYLVVLDGGRVMASGPKAEVLKALQAGKISQGQGGVV